MQQMQFGRTGLVIFLIDLEFSPERRGHPVQYLGERGKSQNKKGRLEEMGRSWELPLASHTMGTCHPFTS
jgi:hypothetical protein